MLMLMCFLGPLEKGFREDQRKATQIFMEPARKQKSEEEPFRV